MNSICSCVRSMINGCYGAAEEYAEICTTNERLRDIYWIGLRHLAAIPELGVADLLPEESVSRAGMTITEASVVAREVIGPEIRAAQERRSLAEETRRDQIIGELGENDPILNARIVEEFSAEFS